RISNRKRQIVGDRLLPLDAIVELIRVVRICNIGEARKREFVVDAGIIDGESCGKHPVADDRMGIRRRDTGENGCCGESARTGQGHFMRHGESSIRAGLNIWRRQELEVEAEAPESSSRTGS